METAELCRRHGISDATFYNWKSKYGGMTVSEVERLMTDYGFSERRACRLIGVNRSAWQYEPLRGKDDAVRERMRELANERRRFGYRRLAIPLRREGKGMNLKKVYRLYREERLTVQPWPRRAPDAPASRPRACRAPVPAMHDRQPPLSVDRRGKRTPVAG